MLIEFKIDVKYFLKKRGNIHHRRAVLVSSKLRHFEKLAIYDFIPIYSVFIGLNKSIHLQELLGAYCWFMKQKWDLYVGNVSFCCVKFNLYGGENDYFKLLNWTIVSLKTVIRHMNTFFNTPGCITLFCRYKTIRIFVCEHGNNKSFQNKKITICIHLLYNTTDWINELLTNIKSALIHKISICSVFP